ncbi:MAG TPA: sensor histidine kinase, partial [Gammaproteobacteria bacterium]|nr:sensor histidine kinase [Gammaproteobacteria bacterium]
MLRTLYSRLALTLFVLLCVVGLALVFLVRDTSALYQQEVAQKLNRSLAAQIVAEQALISDDEVDGEALAHLFHLLMVINPSIELYLLDREGRVLAFSAPEGKVRRARVDLRPVRRFLAGGARFPLAGDDPRDPRRSKVFSAARIPAEGPLQGYLYVILGSEKYDSIVQSLQGSYILRASSW